MDITRKLSDILHLSDKPKDPLNNLTDCQIKEHFKSAITMINNGNLVGGKNQALTCLESANYRKYLRKKLTDWNDSYQRAVDNYDFNRNH